MRKKLAILLNSLIVIFEIIAVYISVKAHGRYPFEYYTDLSNLLALFTSLLFTYYLVFKTYVPRYVNVLKYASTVGLILTFLVVVFILAPMYRFDYIYLFTHEAMFFTHLICPVLGAITFIFFDGIKVTTKDMHYSMYPTFIYAFVLIALNACAFFDGPYPFLRVRNQSILASVLWFLLIMFICNVIALVLRLTNRKTK